MQETSNKSAGINRKPLVIGIGASFRGDDELGLTAVEMLRGQLTEHSTDFATHSDDPARIINEWTGRDGVVVIEAALERITDYLLSVMTKAMEDSAHYADFFWLGDERSAWS